MNMLQIGDRVRANVNSQKLTRGAEYTVTDKRVEGKGAWQYTVVTLDDTLDVINSHLLLSTID